MTIRLATLEDAPALLAIYAKYIRTPITFEYDLPSQKEFAQRIGETLPDYPYLVCERQGCPVGYAYAHRQKERAAYQWNAELSVYLDPDNTSRGLGKAMYRALMELLLLQGIRTVYGGVTLPNAKSEGLHQSLGFSWLGTFHHTGYKNGTWHDVAWFEKALAQGGLDPAPFVPFGRLPSERVEAVLVRCQPGE